MVAWANPVVPSTNGDLSSENPLLLVTEIPLKLLWKNVHPSPPLKKDEYVDFSNQHTHSDVKLIGQYFAFPLIWLMIPNDDAEFAAVLWKQLIKIVQFSPW